jgi:hypothetical protein
VVVLFLSAEYRDQNASIQTGTRNFIKDTIQNTSAATPLRDLFCPIAWTTT